MARSWRWGRALVLALLLVAVQGCKWFELTVQIPDFESREVKGLWVWRKDDASGQWQRAGQILFQGTQTSSGQEQLSYVVMQPDGFGLPLTTPVVRSATRPDLVTLRIWYARFLEEGEYRVSTYNAAGESGLSPESLDLL